MPPLDASQIRNHRLDLMIVLFPLRIEMDLVLKSMQPFLQEFKFEMNQQELFGRHVFQIESLDGSCLIYFAQTGLGKVESALWTQRWIEHLPKTIVETRIETPIESTTDKLSHPSDENTQKTDELNKFFQVIGCGSCASLQDTLKTGDVLVIHEIIEHDFKQRFISRPAPIFKTNANELFPVHDDEKFTSIGHDRFQFHHGRIASGDEDIVSLERRKSLGQESGALAVAWESAGLARACRLQKVPYFEIRAVTDLGQNADLDQFKRQLPQSMENLSHILLLHFKRLLNL